MRKKTAKFTLCILFFYFFHISAQTIQTDLDLAKYIAKTIKYPQQLKEDGKMDLVVVRLLITPQGKIDSIKILAGRHQLAIEESIRLVKSLEGKIDTSYHGELINGNAIILPLSFRLEPDENHDFKKIALKTYFELGNNELNSSHYKTALFFYGRFCNFEPQNKTIIYNKILCLISLQKTETICDEIKQLENLKDTRATELKKEHCH